MRYKMVCVDLDGTLLDDNKEVTTNTINKINEIVNQGALFVVTTGRPFTSTKRYTDLICGNNPVVLYNGGVIRLSKSNEVLYNKALDSTDAKRIIDLINDDNGTFIYWRSETPYVNKIDDYIRGYVRISKVEPLIHNNDYNNITKIIWFNEPKRNEEIKKTLDNKFDNVNFFTSDPRFLEFVSKGVSKGEAVKKLAKFYNIHQDEIMAIGDGDNDLSMIRYAGVGIAMENASSDVKKYANDLTSSNDEEGVLKIINKYFK